MSTGPALDDLGPHVDPLVGKVIAERYRLVRRIGAGGMGSVYEGLHTVIGRKVAVKLLHPQLAADPDQVSRFLNEARAAAAIGHPNIVEAIDMGRADDGAPYLVLEFLEGESLATRISRQGALSAQAAIDLGKQASRALAAAHAKQIVHRDLKPDNLFLARLGDGTESVKILDFGVCKLAGSSPGGGTRTGSVMGTPAYMAPEQLADSSRVDARADVYALGALLYQALSGRLPFDAVTIPRLVEQITQQQPTPLASLRPDLAPELCEVVHLCLEKDPVKRFQTMEALGAALDGLGPQPDAMPGLAQTLPAGSGSLGLAATLPTPPMRAPQPATAPAPLPGPLAPTAAAAPLTPASTAAEPRRRGRRFWKVFGLIMALGYVLPNLGTWLHHPAAAVRKAQEDVRELAADSDGAVRLPCPEHQDACKAHGSGKPLEAWCDAEGKVIACCGAGLVARDSDGVCGCPPGGADPTEPVAGCPAAKQALAPFLSAALETLRPRFKACGKGDKELRGRLEVGFDLTSEGRVVKPRLAASEVTDAAVQSCVLDVFRDARFDPPPGGARPVVVPVQLNSPP